MSKRINPRDSVRRRYPAASCHICVDKIHRVYSHADAGGTTLGSGATKEEAWEDALQRLARQEVTCTLGEAGQIKVRASFGSGCPPVLCLSGRGTDDKEKGWPGSIQIYADIADADAETRAQLRGIAVHILTVLDHVESQPAISHHSSRRCSRQVNSGEAP